MGKLFWLLFLAFCLVNIEAKKADKKAAAAPAAPAAPAESEGTPTDEAAPAEEEGQEEETDAKAEKEPEAAKATDDDNKTGEATEESADAKDTEAEPAKEDDAASEEDSAETAEASEEGAEEEATEKSPEFACNLKFKRVGCYADKSKKDKPLRSFIMSDADLGTTSKKGKLPKGDKFNSELPKFACKCANEAINGGNAIFGIQNIAECWTGPDDSKYDKDGESSDCVTFDYAPCESGSAMCAGKKHANFVYYVDTPEHTKSKEDIAREYASYKKKVAAHEKKKAAKKKSAKKLKKKSKKAKKE